MRPSAGAAALVLALGAVVRAQSPADRVIDGAVPVWQAQLTSHIAGQIAKLARVPLGVEALPRDPRAGLLSADERRDLAGLTVRQALDWLVAIDTRYRWAELGGVIVIRPAAAWEDGRHFLGRHAGDVSIERRAPADLLSSLEAFFRSDSFELQPPAAQSNVLLTFAVADASALDVLNAAVRAGTLLWEVDYGLRMPGKPSLWLSHPRSGASTGVEFPVSLPEWLSAGRKTASPDGDAESPADRIIDGPLTHRHRELSHFVARTIGRLARVPLGMEVFPADRRATPEVLPPAEQRVLTGLTVREALDWLVEIDPRYYWVESRGAIVIRPTLAWGDAKHFLNAIVDDVTIEERDPADFISGLFGFFESGTFAMPLIPSPVWTPMTMSIRHRSVLDVLNEAARAGELHWAVTYEESERPYMGPVQLTIGTMDQYARPGSPMIFLPVRLPEWLVEEKGKGIRNKE